MMTKSKDQRITVRVTEQEMSLLTEYAKIEGMSVAHYLRYQGLHANFEQTAEIKEQSSSIHDINEKSPMIIRMLISIYYYVSRLSRETVSQEVMQEIEDEIIKHLIKYGVEKPGTKLNNKK